MVARLALTLLAGLMLAGVVHVAAVLSLPQAAPRSAVIRLVEAAGGLAAGRPVLLPVPADGSVLPDLDPLFEHAACLFDGAAGPVELTGEMPPDLWTFAVVGQASGVVASLGRSAAVDNAVRLVVGPADAVERIRLARAGEGAGSLNAIAVAGERGFILVRAFVAPGVDRAAVADRLAALDCAAATE